jgi:hypothetical protein
MYEGLTSQRRKQVPEDSLVPGHPCRVVWIVLLDRLFGDDPSNLLVRLGIDAGEKVVELCGANCRQDLCATGDSWPWSTSR